MEEKKLKSIQAFATIALFLLLILSFGFLWGEFKLASGIVDYDEEEKTAIEAETPKYLTGETKEGKTLFQSNCARCHQIERRVTGPPLMNVKDRWADSTNLYSWIKNSQTYLATGDKYANTLYKEYKSIMPAFPNLTEAQIKEILFYVDPEK